jgi:hypothetical protein
LERLGREGENPQRVVVPNDDDDDDDDDVFLLHTLHSLVAILILKHAADHQ